MVAGERESGLQRRTVAIVKVMLTVAGGGFLWQSRNVALGLAEVAELHYVSGEPWHNLEGSGLPDGVRHEVPAVTTFADRHPLRKARNALRASFSCLRLMREVRPEAVVCVATSLAIPLCLCGRLLGVRTVFVESITRVNSPSATGKLLSRLRLCDRLYVQWPEAASLYPGAVYRGALL